jgi:O-methyltransferase domain/Dimerisation domain
MVLVQPHGFMKIHLIRLESAKTRLHLTFFGAPASGRRWGWLMATNPQLEGQQFPQAREQKTHLVTVREEQQPAASATALVEVATGYWAARCLQVIAELGVADALGEEPRTAAELADGVGANADSLDRVLRLLVSLGIFSVSDGRYGHNTLSRAIREDNPHSMRAYLRFVGTPLFWDSYGALEHVVRTGATGVSKIEPRGVFAYFQEHPEIATIFDGAMRGKAESAIGPVLAAYDFSEFETIADVGGGLGHLLKAILGAYPQVRGVLFDLPQVAERVTPAQRLEIQPGDFFRGPLPRCDAYLLMEVLHDWTDAQCAEILRQVRKAAPADAKLLVIETVLPGDARPHFGHHLDINMMVLTGGRERTADEFARLFDANGFRLTRVIPAQGPYTVVEAAAM